MTSDAFDEITAASELPRLVRLGKDLYGCVFTLMKLVPARHILRRAALSGELGPRSTIVETTSGTFGLALAMQAALLGRDLILVTDPVVDPRLVRRLTDLGATVDIRERPDPIGGFQAARLRRVAEIRASLPDTFCPNQYDNPDNPGSYARVAEQLERAFGEIGCVVGPVGSGGSICGTVGALRTTSPATKAVGVDTHGSLLFGQPDGPRSLRGLGNSVLPTNVDHRVFDEVHWCGETEAYAATRHLHRSHALFQGPTSGAAYHVARWWSARNPGDLTVVLLPDEGYRYLDTVYEDGWLARRGIDLATASTAPERTTDPTTPTSVWSWFPWARRSYTDVLGVSSTPAGSAV
ncbi:pyridoxal-phosphate dependent enzyme [Actinoalloteichus caeruleus]|uniref:Cysteine synthase A n=1 Tax=Actinoalloteichus caeruleus DSM 43889 TaxID=1120930 RepID=A0ABT1JDL1_ACTCY|nr:pyridoxal-phosphate dependent enzyme [Actinoalloteichus caeruleus]MCP2330580.1 cysteine synthase A [Actinoalloteichus caeruleus DSM 43889]